MFVYCIFLVGYKGHESVRNDDEKPKKLDAHSESRQGVLAIASAKLGAAK